MINEIEEKRLNKKVITEISGHKLAYLILLLILMAFLAFFFFFGHEPTLLLFAILGLGASYFFWGVLTHLSVDLLNKRVVFEYGLISLLAVVALLLLTW